MSGEDEQDSLFERPQAVLARSGSEATGKPQQKAAPHYLGHRQRLRQRFREAGADALSDYELLELLLFRTIPRSDTKERAKSLLKRFGSLAEVVGAPESLLQEVDAIGEAAALDLKIVSAVAARVTRGAIGKR